MSKEMTFERFDELAMAYGGTLARWPDAARRDGEVFLAAHPDAARSLADASALDAALAGLEAPPVPSDALMARILGDAADVAAGNAAAQRAARPVPRRKSAGIGSIFAGLPRWAPGLAFAASLALGVGIGADERVALAPADAVLALVAPDSDDALDFAFAFDDGGDYDPFLGGEASL